MFPALFILAWYILPVFVYIGLKCCSNRENHIPAILLTMVCGYVLVITIVTTADATDREAMERFDLNRDGKIDEFERTSKAQRAIRNQGRDTGRSLAPILGMPLTAIWYTLLFALLYGGESTFRKLFVRTKNPS